MRLLVFRTRRRGIGRSAGEDLPLWIGAGLHRHIKEMSDHMKAGSRHF